MMGKLKIKQIELKDVDLTTLNENEIYYCELNNYYIQDLYYEHRFAEALKIRRQVHPQTFLFRVMYCAG